MNFGNGRYQIQLQEVPDGVYYKLEIQAPPSYFHEPIGYLFQVKDEQIVRRPGFTFHFRLIPLAEQDLPSCREFEKGYKPTTSDSIFNRADIPADTQKDVCRAEGTVDISAPSKRAERPQEAGTHSAGYHFAGPKTFQDNQGIWGRNTVVDPNIPHVVLPPNERFVVLRVFADDVNSDRWMEAGWAEVSWRDDRQYIYEFDSANDTWVFFDEYVVSPGTTVETDVQYDPNLGMWKARYYLGDGSWRVLAIANLGFTTADRSFNRGEIYTADGVHPILPLSFFDKGYLLIDDIWRLWTTSYDTDVTEDDPYQVDMMNQYHLFNIHSPIIYFPLILNNVP